MKGGWKWLRWPSDAPIVLAIWSALLVLAIGAVMFGRWPLSFVAGATLALSMAPVILARRFQIVLPVALVLAIIGFVFASIFLGEAFEFYERFWWWDMVLHGSSAIGFGLMGFLLTLMMFEGDTFAAPHWALALIAFCIAMTVGSVWEIFEFLMDRIFGMTMQKSGLMDTMGDLMINAVGGLIASVSGYVFLKGRRAGPLRRLIRQFIILNRKFYRRWRDRHLR